jgi:hypothetical protein
MLFISVVLLSFFVFLSSHILPILTEGVSEQGAKERIWTLSGKKFDKFWVKFHNEELRDQFFLPPFFGWSDQET